MTTSSGKQLEDFSHALVVCLMYKLVTTAKGCDDLSVGFDCSRDRRKQELINNKNQKGKYEIRIHLNDIFRFAEHQEKPTLGFGYKVTLTRHNDSSVLNKDKAINIGKIKIIAIEWYVPNYTPSIPQRAILLKRILSELPTELQ